MLHAPEDSLGFVPDWFERVVAEAVERRSALITRRGGTRSPRCSTTWTPTGSRATTCRRPPTLAAAIDRGAVAWTVVPGPCPGMAEAMLGEPDVERLWALIAPLVRLDAPDPVAAWREHVRRLEARARELQERAFDAVRFRGGGTDLTIGLAAERRWISAADDHRMGRAHGRRTCRRRRCSPRRTSAAWTGT